MKDLKHMHYYASLLESAHNELVQKAIQEGGTAIGYTCYYIPEVLLNVGSAFSVRLRAPNTGSLDISQYYMAKFLTKELDVTFSADEHLHPGNENSKKIIYMDELIPKILLAGFRDHPGILAQMCPVYLPSLINQLSTNHYIDVAESYGLPADLCPLPPLEAGCAIEDDYPKMGCCFISSSMPCDGSIMTTTLQDRRFNLPTYALNVPMRWTRDDVQEYAVEEIKACIAFMEEHTGERYDYDKLRDACEIMNQQTRLKMEKWEMNQTDAPPHTGSTVWLYRIFTYQCACGDPGLLKNDQKVNAILRKTLGRRTYPKTVRHRAVVWNTPANMYPNFSNWISDCWGVECVCDMIDHQGSMIIDIGGQDVKGIAVAEDGTVKNFAMNDKCAAGTGKFYEAMARAFEMSLEEFSNLSLTAKNVIPITAQCTVFAESEVISLVGDGKPKEEIAAGLQVAIAKRCFVMAKKAGTDGKITLTGGCAKNAGLKKAIEHVLKIKVVELKTDPQLMGALGAAEYARQKGMAQAE